MNPLMGSFALDLLLAINGKVVKEIPNVVHWASVKMSENSLEYHIGYAIPTVPVPFCDLCIFVSQPGSSELFIDVCADYEYQNLQDLDMYKIKVNNLISQHIDLKPSITKEVVTSFDRDDFDKPITKQIFRIKYVAYHYTSAEKGIIWENHEFDKIANDIFPYIKSLHEISKIIHPNYENLERDII
jgi:hypothetical protein